VVDSSEYVIKGRDQCQIPFNMVMKEEHVNEGQQVVVTDSLNMIMKVINQRRSFLIILMRG
jgi:hypothetical protein